MDLAPRRVECQVAAAQDCRALRAPASHERPQAGLQLGERERLGQVVVGAAVQPSHAVVHAIERGEH